MDMPISIRTCEAIAADRRAWNERPRDGAAPWAPFEIHDPFGVRNAIVPVFRQDPQGRMYGMGTAFHVDGFGGFLTAYHVIDFVQTLGQGQPILFLSMHGVVFGTVPIPQDCFVALQHVQASVTQGDDPMAALRGERSAQPAVDIASLQIGRTGPEVRWPQSLPARVAGGVPEVGDMVLAVGFAQLDLSEMDPSRQRALLTEGMYGAYGRVVALHRDGVSRTNPTPVFEVEADWPPGMSGGPVFNRKGDVIGLVSRSLRADGEAAGAGYAACFGMIPDLRYLAPRVDRDNPGWRRAWAVFAPGSEHADGWYPDAGAAEAALPGAEHEVRAVAHRIGSEDFVELAAPGMTTDPSSEPVLATPRAAGWGATLLGIAASSVAVALLAYGRGRAFDDWSGLAPIYRLLWAPMAFAVGCLLGLAIAGLARWRRWPALAAPRVAFVWGTMLGLAGLTQLMAPWWRAAESIVAVAIVVLCIAARYRWRGESS